LKLELEKSLSLRTSPENKFRKSQVNLTQTLQVESLTPQFSRIRPIRTPFYPPWFEHIPKTKCFRIPDVSGEDKVLKGDEHQAALRETQPELIIWNGIKLPLKRFRTLFSPTWPGYVETQTLPLVARVSATKEAGIDLTDVEQFWCIATCGEFIVRL
jgi:hypothetical protein